MSDKPSVVSGVAGPSKDGPLVIKEAQVAKLEKGKTYMMIVNLALTELVPTEQLEAVRENVIASVKDIFPEYDIRVLLTVGGVSVEFAEAE